MSSDSIQGQPDGHLGAISDTSMVSPMIDFLMVGGLFIPFFVLSFFLPELSGGALENITLVVFLILFVVNYPHFMHSYQLLYEGFRDKLTSSDVPVKARVRYWIAGVISPFAIAVCLFFAVLSGSAMAVGYGLNAMYFFVGWHYVKQGYGVFVALSVKKKVFLGGVEKGILLVNAYVVWLFSWLFMNLGDGVYYQKDIPFQTFDPPFWLVTTFLFMAVFTSLITFVTLVARFGKKGLSFNGAVGYFCSLYPWTVSAMLGPVLVLLIPVFHSLQYLLFVWKMRYEKEKVRGDFSGLMVNSQKGVVKGLIKTRMFLFLVIGYVSGAVSFFIIPKTLDYVVPYDHDVFGTNLFIVLFLIFINIHHYFIDFSLWRKENPDMAYLFR